MTSARNGAARASQVADRLAPFGTTIFAEMTRLAVQHGAVNLAQGFPDFDGPEFVKSAAQEAIRAGRNQYARTFGDPALTGAIAERWRRATGEEIDPDTSVTVTSGCTEAIPAAILGLVNAGESVVLFEPYYDSYRACVAMAGARARVVTLHAPAAGAGTGRGVDPGAARGLCDPSREFWFDPDALERVMSECPRAIVVNTPHNPTGKVFTRRELEFIASLCVRHDVLAITDEVYGELLFEADRPHVRLATLEGMRERTVTLDSLGKTFSLTGWKIGWSVAPPALTRGVRAAHQFLTFATCTPMQHAAAVALREGDGYVSELVREYGRKRDFLSDALRSCGLEVFSPAGTYFVMADHTRLGFADDREFCRALTEQGGVAAIPPSVFYDDPASGRSLARFAFCKRDETLREAAARLVKFAASRRG